MPNMAADGVLTPWKTQTTLGFIRASGTRIGLSSFTALSLHYFFSPFYLFNSAFRRKRTIPFLCSSGTPRTIRDYVRQVL